MAKRRNKKLTLAELKTYIEGAVEFNPDDWVPDKEQWDYIVELIMGVKDTPAPAAPVAEQQIVQQPE